MNLADVAEAIRFPSFRGMSVGRRLAVATGVAGCVLALLAFFQLHDDIQVGVVMFLGLLGVGLTTAVVLRR